MTQWYSIDPEPPCTCITAHDRMVCVGWCEPRLVKHQKRDVNDASDPLPSPEAHAKEVWEWLRDVIPERKEEG